MKKFCLMTLTLIVVLTWVSPVAASGPTGTIGIFSVAACQDTTTVAVSGTASAATNRIKAWIYKPNDKGEWIQLAYTVTANFTSGRLYDAPGARLLWQFREGWNAAASGSEDCKASVATALSM